MFRHLDEVEKISRKCRSLEKENKMLKINLSLNETKHHREGKFIQFHYNYIFVWSYYDSVEGLSMIALTKKFFFFY